MKIEIDEVKKSTAEEMYQVGNVIENEGELYLVIKTDERWGLLDLDDNRVMFLSESLNKLAKRVASSSDRLIDVKIVRA